MIMKNLIDKVKIKKVLNLVGERIIKIFGIIPYIKTLRAKKSRRLSILYVDEQLYKQKNFITDEYFTEHDLYK